MTPMRRKPGAVGPDVQAMLPPPPMQFAPPPPMPPPDATGAQALGGNLANMALMLQARMAQPSPGEAGAGAASEVMGGAGPTDAPNRRKASFGQAASGVLNYA